MKARFLKTALGLAGVIATALPGAAQQTEAERAVGSRLASEYTALRERPLFSPDRSPPASFAETPAIVEPEPEPEPELPVAAPETAPQWQLVGVVRSSSGNSAVFQTDGGASVFRLRQGESREGWTLARVDRFEVALDSDHARAFLRFADD